LILFYILKKFILIILFYISFFLFIFINFSSAVEPEEFMQDEKNELRARDISKNIRCLVCQNQSIDDSSAELAKDLRILIRKKISDGSTNKEIYDFLSARYGDFILLNPPLKLNTIVLWTFPFILLFFSIFLIYWHNKKSDSKEIK
tara:strand:+ start:948 stop:1385 length:438 start_codon:yes stop_codon:yes gene_type:complete